MSNQTASALGKLMPGFDFLQSFSQASKNAASGLAGLAGLPQASQWIAPTLSVEELEKRIAELKTVQFWLDQNARALQATITALEVQKMTLSTLKGMNLDLSTMGKFFQSPTPEKNVAANPLPEKTSPPAKKERKQSTAPTPQLVDPMQWWGQLTEQFAAIAQEAMKQAGTQAVKSIAETGLDVAKNQMKKGVQSATKKLAASADSVKKKAKKSIKK